MPRMGISTQWRAILYLITSVGLASSASLADFQPINGFSTACTTTYKTPLQACIAADFLPGASCSTLCVAFLDELTQALSIQCAGVNASPDTLLGMFFANKGTKALCPNAATTLPSLAVSSPDGGAGNIAPVLANQNKATSNYQVLSTFRTMSSSSSLLPISSYIDPHSTVSSSSSTTTATTESSAILISSSQSTYYTATSSTVALAVISSTRTSSTQSAHTSGTKSGKSGSGGTFLDLSGSTSSSSAQRSSGVIKKALHAIIMSAAIGAQFLMP